jgi:NAD(P)-dependent dehydrogenase (short-subunit alcohol dehydrogenase family)
MTSLTGKNVLITGASSGLGEYFAKVVANAGATAIVTARRQEKLAQLVRQIKAQGGRAIAVQMDVTSANSVDSALISIEQQVGNIDILINNAGLAKPQHFLDATEDDWDLIINTNLKAAWRLANEVSKGFVKANIPGCIVNIASILGLRVGYGDSIYAISKAGVVQMTKALALELSNNNIRVNALCPGYFATEMNADYFASDKGKAYIQKMPAKRLGHLSELDGPLLLLCSNAGSFINGVALPVDGGHMVTSL